MAAARKSKIYFFFKRPVSLRDRTKLKAFVERIFRKEGVPLFSLNYVFCSDEDLLAINREYLKHDYYTDIISFGLSEAGAPVEGEVYISVDRVRDNARTLDQFFYRELHRVVFHGALHLCGYKDGKPKDKEKMRKMEEKYLSLYF